VVGRDAVTEFPTVDLSRSDPGEVDRVCRDTGFLAIVGHELPQTLIDEMWQVTREFFDLPLERKMRVAIPSGNLYGYAPFAEEALAQSMDAHTPPDLPDLKETFSIGPADSPTL
jgi:isopenicillin N synthase-like dioxygenase